MLNLEQACATYRFRIFSGIYRARVVQWYKLSGMPAIHQLPK